MNKKVEIWKRKLVKNKTKQQKAVWDALTKDPMTIPEPRILHAKYTFSNNIDQFDIATSAFKEFGNAMRKMVDSDIMKSLTGKASKYE